MDRPRLSPAIRFAILDRDFFACRYCGARAPEAKLHIDHVIPFSKGGQTLPKNLVTSCSKCNSGKGSSAIRTDHLPFSEEDLEANLRIEAKIKSASKPVPGRSRGRPNKWRELYEPVCNLADLGLNPKEICRSIKEDPSLPNICVALVYSCLAFRRENPDFKIKLSPE